MINDIVEKAKEYIKLLFENNSDGHDYNHTIRVYDLAKKIATKYDCNVLVVSLASLLHDVDDYKLFDTNNNENARKFMKSIDLDDNIIENVCNVINSISFSKNKDKVVDSIEAKIVQDADRLDAMGAIGIARTFAYGGGHNRSLKESLNHFDEKLLLLKERINTKEGKEIAEERHSFLIEYLNELRKETDNNL